MPFAVVTSLYVPKVVKFTLYLTRIIPHILVFCNSFREFSENSRVIFEELPYRGWYVHIE